MIPGFFVYVYILLGLLVCVFDIVKTPPKQYNRIFNVTIFFLAFLAAFSYGVGSDTMAYRDEFREMPTLSKLSVDDFLFTRYQPLYVLICSSCRTIYDDLLALQILQITLFYHSFYIVLKKLDLRKFWVLFLFFGYCFIAILSARRECFGLAFCLYAIPYFVGKKWVRYYILVFAGFLCHTGMIVFALFPLIKLLGKNDYLNISFIFLLVYLVKFILPYAQLLEGVVNNDDSLLRYGLDNSEKMGISTIILCLCQLAVFVWFAIKKNRGYLKGYARDFVYIGILYVTLGFLSSSLPILYRFRVHFSIFSYYTLSICFKNAKRYGAIIVFLIFVVFSYTPLSTFINACKIEPLTYNYCSYFSSQESKRQMDMLAR